MRLHLTLHFIGSFPRAAIDDLAARLATVAERPLMLRADRAEMWPGGLAVLRIDPEPALLDLQRELGSLLSALALPIDTRPYAPHVTLARKADAARAPDTRPVLDWNARGFELVESVGGANPSYAVLRSFPATG